MVVFGFYPEIFEDALLPESLHVVPVLDLTVTDGVAQSVVAGTTGVVTQCLITDIKVKVFSSSLLCDVSTRASGKEGKVRRVAGAST